MTKTRITVVVENTTRIPGLLAEHGLAYWIEHKDRRVLLDTGQGDVLVHNAHRLGVPLSEIDALTLSHGHCDHTGGVADALRTDRRVAIHVHPAAFKPKYVRRDDGAGQEIGMPYEANGSIRDSRNRLVVTEGPIEVFEGLWTTGAVPRETDFEDTGGPFFLDAGCTKPDPLDDDQAMFFDSPEGVVVLLGCAHAGVINTLRHVRRLTAGRPIRTVMGGMHLIGASEKRIGRTIEELQAMAVQQFAPAHCTALPATLALWRAFPDRFLPFSVGSRFEYETT